MQVGQHVLCIRKISESSRLRAEARHGIPLKAPQLNKVYTVRSLHEVNGKIFVRLAEIVNPLNKRGREPGINSRTFRPLSKLKVEDFATTKEPVES